jgi:HEPN domain-containing protein
MRALFVERTRAIPPRTHDLEYLGTELSVPDKVARALPAINPASDITRYPDQENLVAPVEFIDVEIASIVVTAAIEVMVWLEDQLASR